jgi:hypothetical protein
MLVLFVENEADELMIRSYISRLMKTATISAVSRNANRVIGHHPCLIACGNVSLVEYSDTKAQGLDSSKP